MNKRLLSIILCVVSFSGCAFLWDAPRNILGFSTRDMEAARKDSSYQVYKAAPGDVFSSVVEELEKAKYYVFTKDEARGLVVVMGIPGVVDTTEVGVFISSMGDGGVKVELSSRSTPAKRKVAQELFAKLAERFSQNK